MHLDISRPVASRYRIQLGLARSRWSGLQPVFGNFATSVACTTFSYFFLKPPRLPGVLNPGMRAVFGSVIHVLLQGRSFPGATCLDVDWWGLLRSLLDKCLLFNSHLNWSLEESRSEASFPSWKTCPHLKPDHSEVSQDISMIVLAVYWMVLECLVNAPARFSRRDYVEMVSIVHSCTYCQVMLRKCRSFAGLAFLVCGLTATSSILITKGCGRLQFHAVMVPIAVAQIAFLHIRRGPGTMK